MRLQLAEQESAASQLRQAKEEAEAAAAQLEKSKEEAEAAVNQMRSQLQSAQEQAALARKQAAEVDAYKQQLSEVRMCAVCAGRSRFCGRGSVHIQAALHCAAHTDS
jgi:outer membrane protein TolC